VDGTGLIDCHLYEQPDRLILHVVNLTSEATWRGPLHELIRVGPFTVRIRVPRPAGRRARLLVSGGERSVRTDGDNSVIELDSILDHEVVVLPTNQG
jgi:hypothetical protein